MSKDTIDAWAGTESNAAQGTLVFQKVPAKTWEETDVDVKVLYCGLCATDIGGLSGHAGPFSASDPVVCGHEIIGEVTKAGKEVTNVKVGDVVGIGYQSDSCRQCEWCDNDNEECCAYMVDTIGGPYKRQPVKGERARGGFAKTWRGPARFAIPLPRGLDPSTAGPLFCGGITVFTPLKKNGAGTTAKRVGVIGVGGLGHMAIMFAKAMGAEVTAISRSDSKKADAQKLGATGYIATGNDLAAAFKPHARTLDLIICTINPANVPVADYLTLLRPDGRWIMVGVPEQPLTVPGIPLILKNVSVGGSHIGSPSEIRAMLDFVAANKIQPWVQKYNMDDINSALKDFNAGKPNFRFVLVNTDNGAKL